MKVAIVRMERVKKMMKRVGRGRKPTRPEKMEAVRRMEK
jgi:hypothetical protein